MNTLLKITLNNAHPFGQREIARTAIMCDKNQVNEIIHKFFSCFNMSEPSPWHNQFFVEITTAPIWAFDDPAILQDVSAIDENNPFMLNI